MKDPSVDELKAILIENCMLEVPVEEIGPETELLGAKGVGLDSLDVLQMTVAIEKVYGVKFSGAEEAQHAFLSLTALRTWLVRKMNE